MFYRTKWLVSSGSLGEPWLIGKYNGNVPDYINNTSTNNDMKKACKCLQEVLESNSTNVKHRISLRLSAELSHGVCSMYRNRVENLFGEIGDVNSPTILSEDSRSSESVKEIPLLFQFSDANRVNSENEQIFSLEQNVRDNVPSDDLNETIGNDFQTVTRDLLTSVASCPLSHTSQEELKMYGNDNRRLPLYESKSHSKFKKSLSVSDLEICSSYDSNSHQYQLFEDSIRRKEMSNESDSGLEYTKKRMKNKTSSLTANCDKSFGGRMSSNNFNYLKIQDTYSHFMEQNMIDSYQSFPVYKKTRHMVFKDSITQLPKESEKKLGSPLRHTKSKKKVLIDKINILLKKTNFIMKKPGHHSIAKVLKKMWENAPEDVRGKKSYEEENVCEVNEYNVSNTSNSMHHVTMRRPMMDIHHQNISPISCASQNQSIQDSSEGKIEFLSNIMQSDQHMSQGNTSDHSQFDELLSSDSGDVVGAFDSRRLQHNNVVHVILPMYLRYRVNPNDLRVLVGPIEHCGDIKVQINSDNDLENMFIQETNYGNLNLSSLNYNEKEVYGKLVTLWQRNPLITPETLVIQTSHNKHNHTARARIFRSVLGLKSKGIVKCVKNKYGHIKYIAKGNVAEELMFNLSE